MLSCCSRCFKYLCTHQRKSLFWSDFVRLLDEWEVGQWNWMRTFQVDRLIYKVTKQFCVRRVVIVCRSLVIGSCSLIKSLGRGILVNFVHFCWLWALKLMLAKEILLRYNKFLSQGVMGMFNVLWGGSGVSLCPSPFPYSLARRLPS